MNQYWLEFYWVSSCHFEWKYHTTLFYLAKYEEINEVSFITRTIIILYWSLTWYHLEYLLSTAWDILHEINRTIMWRLVLQLNYCFTSIINTTLVDYVRITVYIIGYYICSPEGNHKWLSEVFLSSFAFV